MRILTVMILGIFAQHCHANTSAVLDSSFTHIEVKAIDKMYITEFKRWEIRDENGYRHCLYNDYENQFRKVRSLRYTVYDASGKRVKRFGIGDLRHLMFNASYAVTDSRMLLLDPGYRSFPFTVEIETVVSYDEFLDFPAWMPRYSHNMEVRFAKLTFECPSDYRFRCRSINTELDSTMSELDGVKTYSWVLKNLPAIRQYASDRSFEDDQIKVSISPYNFRMGDVAGSYSGWANFGDWYLALNKDPYVLSETTKRDLNLISQNSTDEKDLVRKVYEYMQRKTRYVSIQLGIGGFKALPVEEVDENGYGDCKALSHYMHALLAHVGVAAHYVLVNAGNDVPDVIVDMPSNQFNHIFLGVPHIAADTTWLECTSQVVPASYLGKFTDDRNVLWIDAGRSKIIRTPRFTASESVCKSESAVRVDANGDALITINRLQGGFHFDDMIGYGSMTSVQKEQYNLSKFPYADFSIQSFKYSVRAPDMVLALEYQLKVNSLATHAGNRLLLPLNIFNPPEKDFYLDLANKEAEVKRAFTQHDIMEVTLPDGFRHGTLPERKSVSSLFGTLEISVTSNDENRYVVTRKLTLNKGAYSGEDFLQFHEFLRTIKSVDQTRVVIASKT